jgi:hypothetical protein
MAHQSQTTWKQMPNGAAASNTMSAHLKHYLIPTDLRRVSRTVTSRVEQRPLLYQNLGS